VTAFDLESSIERLIVEEADFLELERNLGGFCLFEAMGAVWAEVRQGNLLAALLDRKPHMALELVSYEHS
jgi:hypothetical protein